MVRSLPRQRLLGLLPEVSGARRKVTGAAAIPFRLEPVNAPPRSLAKKPGPWLDRVERATRAHREARSDLLLEAGRERAAEALWVRDALTEGKREELGLWVAPGRALPGGTPEVLRVIRRWDTELSRSSRGTRRLLRADHESAEHWAERVLAEAERRTESAWHTSRAQGQRERFRRVAECATESRGHLICVHCRELVRGSDGAAIVLRDLCGSHLLCLRCRDQRRKKYRAAFARARKAAVVEVRRRRLGAGQVRRDPLAERFLTLTCPHLSLADGGPEAQARLVRGAFRRFMNALRNHWRAHRGFALTRYVRVLEATSGRDALGHVHIHVWLLSPFVRVQVLRALWGRALLAEGFPRELWPEHAWKLKAELLGELESDPSARAWAKHVLAQRIAYPRVDIRRVTPRGDGATVDGADLASELIKYLTKDIEAATDGSGPVLMHPELFAAVYRGLDGGRMLSAARGFWIRYHAECSCCGAVDSLRPIESARAAPGLARAPPGLFPGVSLGVCQAV